jgi:hypothetical protein
MTKPIFPSEGRNPIFWANWGGWGLVFKLLLFERDAIPGL